MLKKLLGPALSLDWKITVLTISTTLLIMLDQYHQVFTAHHWESLLLYFAVPFLIVILVFRETPAQYGFTFGDWKAGLALTGMAVLIMLPILWWVNLQSGGMQDYYSGSVNGQFLAHVLVDLFGWAAWRTKSFLYPWLIHFFVWSFTVIVTSGLLN